MTLPSTISVNLNRGNTDPVIRINRIDDILTSTSPLSLKNLGLADQFDHIDKMLDVDTTAKENGGTLIYNGTSGLYEVKVPALKATYSRPVNLANNELAFSTSTTTLWIGNPGDRSTANVLPIGAPISNFASNTQLGEVSTSGSNNELASTYAIKKFVDLRVSSDIISNNKVIGTLLPLVSNSVSLGSPTYMYNNVHAYSATFNNLTVTGTFTTVDTVTLTIKDPLLELASNQSNSAVYVDAADIGFYGSYGSTSIKRYTGLVRDHSNGDYYLFDGDENVVSNQQVVIENLTPTTLHTYLDTGGIVSTIDLTTITANSSHSVNIVANTLTLSTGISVEIGGTGHTQFTSGAILYGNTTGPLGEITPGSNGQFLQIIDGVPAFGGIDGGTF